MFYGIMYLEWNTSTYVVHWSISWPSFVSQDLSSGPYSLWESHS